MLFSFSTVYIHLQKLRENDPTGWWQINSPAAQTTSPMFGEGAMEANSEYLEVQVSLAAQSRNTGREKHAVPQDERFNGFGGTADDLCESGKRGKRTGNACARTKAKKSAYCKPHTCQKKTCYRLKSSNVDNCNEHADT